MIQTPIRTAVVGIGGFGSAHHTALLALEQQGVIKVIATCDPRAEALAVEQTTFDFVNRGVTVYTDFEAMLSAHAAGLDLVTVAAPIGFHAPMHRACVERGLACYLEKPPTLDPVELEAMIATDIKATHTTHVGFNYIYQPFRHELRKQILEGTFGALKQISLLAQWPRDLGYYGRNNWAGKLLLKDYILLDSVCGNAAAHHVQNILFFAGSDAGYANPQTIETELYRANAIEGADAIFTRGTLENGVAFRIAAVHACASAPETLEIIECEEATIEISPANSKVKVTYRDGRVEETEASRASLFDNLTLFCQILQGTLAKPPVTLEDCRAFVSLNALLYVSGQRITPVSEEHLTRDKNIERPGHEMISINGVIPVMETMLATGQFPSEQGISWGSPGGKATYADLCQLRPTLQAMRAASGVV